MKTAPPWWAMLACLLLLPSLALAQGLAPEHDGDETEASEGEDDSRLAAWVVNYYERIGSAPSPTELEQGVRSVQLMLSDGVSEARILDAIESAVRLHAPGRRIPFSVAVPLRVRPASTGEPAPEPERPAPRIDDDPDPFGPDSLDGVAADEDPEDETGSVVEERWVQRQEDLRQRRNRLRLYLQWRDRTRDQRILLSVGVPMLLGGWAGTWAVSGTALTYGEVPPSVGWTGAIPVVGPILFGALTDGNYPPVFVFAGFQGIGLALVIAGLAQRYDLPYERDPTALHIGRDPKSGRPALSLQPKMLGLGAGLSGRF